MTNLSNALTDLVIQFNNCITERDLSGLSDLFSEDHVFIDSAGSMVKGKSSCLEVWKGFFTTFPDYYNEFDRVEEMGGFVAVAGRSVCSDSRLHGPALWRAVIVDDLIAEWHVLDDTEENRRTLSLSA